MSVFSAWMSSFTPAVTFSSTPTRSEEHTSELQSPCNLVCRLLLEKKNLCHNSALAMCSDLIVGACTTASTHAAHRRGTGSADCRSLVPYDAHNRLTYSATAERDDDDCKHVQGVDELRGHHARAPTNYGHQDEFEKQGLNAWAQETKETRYDVRLAHVSHILIFFFI